VTATSRVRSESVVKVITSVGTSEGTDAVEAVGEVARAQPLLVELADGCLGNAPDEDYVVGHPVPGEPDPQVVPQFLGGDRALRLDTGEGAFEPGVVRDRDHHRLADHRVRHQRVL